MQHITRAQDILLDPDSRAEYDALLAAWEGPISPDGTPVIALGTAYAPRLMGQTAEQVESGFGRLVALLDRQPDLGTEDRVTRIEQRLARANRREPVDAEEVNDLQDDYEEALFALDRRLALEEQQRSQGALGRDISGQGEGERHWRVSANYAAETAIEIAGIRERTAAELTALASGSFATRLAILAGEVTASADIVPARDAADYLLPVYFDDQAARVQALAERRQAIMQKRLGNMRIAYPAMELQTRLHGGLVVGLEAEVGTSWYILSPGGIPDPANIGQYLVDGNYAAAIDAGYNIITTAHLENIEEEDLVHRAFVLHKARYTEASAAE
jgi:hypothetical protein